MENIKHIGLIAQNPRSEEWAEVVIDTNENVARTETGIGYMATLPGVYATRNFKLDGEEISTEEALTLLTEETGREKYIDEVK